MEGVAATYVAVDRAVDPSRGIIEPDTRTLNGSARTISVEDDIGERMGGSPLSAIGASIRSGIALENGRRNDHRPTIR